MEERDRLIVEWAITLQEEYARLVVFLHGCEPEPYGAVRRQMEAIEMQLGRLGWRVFYTGPLPPPLPPRPPDPPPPPQYAPLNEVFAAPPERRCEFVRDGLQCMNHKTVRYPDRRFCHHHQPDRIAARAADGPVPVPRRTTPTPDPPPDPGARWRDWEHSIAEYFPDPAPLPVIEEHGPERAAHVLASDVKRSADMLIARGYGCLQRYRRSRRYEGFR